MTDKSAAAPMGPDEFSDCLRDLAIDTHALALVTNQHRRNVQRYYKRGVPAEVAAWLREEVRRLHAGRTRPTMAAWQNRRTDNPPPHPPFASAHADEGMGLDANSPSVEGSRLDAERGRLAAAG